MACYSREHLQVCSLAACSAAGQWLDPFSFKADMQHLHVLPAEEKAVGAASQELPPHRCQWQAA